MKCRIRANEPQILRTAQAGDTFQVHLPELCECVCAALCDNAAEPAVFSRSGHRGANCNEFIDIVVIACRVAAGEFAHLPVGYGLSVNADQPITFVDPVSTVDFVERRFDAAQAVAPAPTEPGPHPDRL